MDSWPSHFHESGFFFDVEAVFDGNAPRRRAAGTYDSKAGQKLPGKARAYTTTKHYLSAALRKTTLEIGSHDVELIVSSN